MTEQEYQELREKCKELNKQRSVMTDTEKEDLVKLKKRRDDAKLLRDRIFFNENQLKKFTFIHGACNELSGKKELWANRIVLQQTALETSRENFKNF